MHNQESSIETKRSKIDQKQTVWDIQNNSLK